MFQTIIDPRIELQLLKGEGVNSITFSFELKCFEATMDNLL